MAAEIAGDVPAIRAGRRDASMRPRRMAAEIAVIHNKIVLERVLQ